MRLREDSDDRSVMPRNWAGRVREKERCKGNRDGEKVVKKQKDKE